ncbi:MAG: amino acid permease [Phycisphaerae bacterium]|nr:amino acid permease [Phycisphaerae bacterium]MCZ2400750.1 amino acid permease [Phycisphaerae bacterium]NUQ48378.1 amino acid permease [Phycisphaerae bacterium]
MRAETVGDPAPTLRRVLGPLDATCIVIGAIIGVGIFFTPSRVAAIAGSGQLALLAWAVGGAIALAGALTFAALGRAYHNAGGQYEVLRDAYGPGPAFVFVFCNATAVQGGAIAIIAVVCAQNLGIALAGAAPAEPAVTLIAALLIVGLSGANLAGVRCGAGIQNLTVFAKVATLLLIVALALPWQPSEPDATSPFTPVGLTPPPSGPLAFGGLIFAAIVPAFFAYGGWQHALWMAGEIRNAPRNVPLAIIVGVVIVVAVYLLANWAYLELLGHAALAASSTPAADAVGAAWPVLGRRLVAGAVAVSALGVLNAQLLSGPRLVYRMACDGRFFAAFGRISPRFGTPVAAIGLLGGVALILLGLLTVAQESVDRLLTGVVFIDGVFFLLTGLALLVLRARPGSRVRPPPSFGYPVVPLLFVAGEVGILLGAYLEPAGPRAALASTLWIGAGLGCYLLLFRGGAGRAGRAGPSEGA